jgi:hypothetical protein
MSTYFPAQELVIRHPIDEANLDASSTLQETHLIQTESLKDVLRTEEHFSSEVKSFVVLSPPKFKQVSRKGGKKLLRIWNFT